MEKSGGKTEKGRDGRGDGNKRRREVKGKRTRRGVQRQGKRGMKRGREEVVAICEVLSAEDQCGRQSRPFCNLDAMSQ